MRALIIALDGVHASTFGIRADAILDACMQDQVSVDRSKSLAYLPGHTIAESVDSLLHMEDDPPPMS